MARRGRKPGERGYRGGNWAERKRARLHGLAHPPECAIYTWCPEPPNHLPCDCGQQHGVRDIIYGE